jgi:DNA (cytosine-5)-methyltransferase 1
MLTAIDLFCGAGGLTRGLIDAGIDDVCGVDVNEDCRATYDFNNNPSTFMLSDIRDVSAESFTIPSNRSLLLAGCAPCQPFSTHQRSKSSRLDRTLLAEVSRLVCELEPDWVFIENVPGLARVSGFSTYRRFQRAFALLGFEVVSGIVDAKRYGVPQTRKRLVLLASKHCVPSLPAETHGIDGVAYRTVRHAIAHFPKLASGECCGYIANHRAASLSD